MKPLQLLGRKTKEAESLGVVWHEAIQGRQDKDITSTFWKFLLFNRNAKSIVIWADSCSSQK